MREQWNNNRFTLNGRVKPPIVLRSDTEIFIAQNAHNLIWEKYRGEHDALEDEIKNPEGNKSETDERWNALYATAKQEIDRLIECEISAYRKERAGNNAFCAEERFEQIEKLLIEIRDLTEDAQSAAEDAQSTAEEILEKLEKDDGDNE